MCCISVEGSGPVIVMTTKDLGGPHVDEHTHTHKHTAILQKELER